jgi:hypothetical protein
MPVPQSREVEFRAYLFSRRYSLKKFNLYGFFLPLRAHVEICLLFNFNNQVSNEVLVKTNTQRSPLQLFGDMQQAY